MTGYVRKDTTNNIADGNVINAADLDSEFDGVQAAFNSSTGHTHDGTASEGAPITKLGPVQDVTISTTVLGVKTTNTVDLGTSSLKFKDFYLAGNASIGGTLTYGGVTLSNAVTGTGNMVLSASPTLTGTLTAATITASGTITGNGNWVLGNADTDTITQTASYVTGTQLKSAKVATNTLSLAAYDVDGVAYTNLITLTASNTPTLALTSTGVGTINNMSIGATTASTGAFTTLSASGAVTLSGGTANGVAYLNGTNVLTTGSALTFDGASLSVNSGTTNTAAIFTSTDAGAGIRLTDPTGSSSFETNGSLLRIGVDEDNVVASSEVAFRIDGSEKMRLTSTGLGIGTSSPTNALSVSGNANITGNTTLGDASTDTVTVNGYMGVGGAGDASRAINVTSTALTGANQTGVYSALVGSASATSTVRGFTALVQTAAASFTAADVAGFWYAGASKGAGSTITNSHGLYIPDLTAGVNNYGITSLVSSGTNKWNIYASGTADNYFAGDVGIGASSPSAKLDVIGDSFLRGNLGVYSSTGGAVNSTLLTFGSAALINAASIYSKTDSSTAGNLVLATAQSGTGVMTERMRIDSAGNLGLGVTPSAWQSQYKTFDFGNRGGLATEGTAVQLSLNGYYNAGWKYKQSSFASLYEQYNGIHAWYTAPSGTAGNAITFTQAMTLDASGNLGIGTTAPANLLEVSATSAGANSFLARFRNAGTTTGTQASLLLTTNTNTGGTASSQLSSIAENTTGNTALILGTSFSGSSPVERARIDSSGNLGIGTSSPAVTLSVAGTIGVFGGSLNGSIGSPQLYRPASDTLAIATGAVERMRIDSSGNLLVGQTSKTTGAQSTAKLGVSSGITLTNGSYGGFMEGVNTSGTTYGYLSLGSAYNAFSAGDVGLGTSGALPLLFATNNIERARFNSTGALVFAGGTTTANGIGITFPATQSASTDANTLDDYEEGTWTPVLEGTSSNPTVTYTVQTGKYTKIGRLVCVWGRISLSNRTGGTGNIQINGLPFSAGGSNNEFPGSLECGFVTFSSGYTAVNVRALTSSTVMSVSQIGSNVTGNGVPITNVATNADFVFSCSYFV